MKLTEALQVLKVPVPETAATTRVLLACGFTPLHFGTFLKATLRQLTPDRNVHVDTGLYGDLIGTLHRDVGAPVDATVFVLEWSDLDPRLGLRHSGRIEARDFPDIAKTVSQRIALFKEAIAHVLDSGPVVGVLPTLPWPFISYHPTWQVGPLEADIRVLLGELCSWLVAQPRARLLSDQALARHSPQDSRWDVSAELSSGFPYRLPHAAFLASQVARMIAPPAAKKGLVTDLDNTLWKGVLGDVGPAGISWDLDHRSQRHAWYQKLLFSLAESGVLIAVASKNEPDRVQEAFARRDLGIGASQVFPFEVNWGPKSHSIERILKTWNIGSDAVVLVDDTLLELNEVKEAFPALECLRFPDTDAEVYALLETLRDLFGKGSVSTDDRLRLDSIRRNASLSLSPTHDPLAPVSSFLQESAAVLTFAFAKGHVGPRPLELINKTNQFNLNGRRLSEADWQSRLKAPDHFLIQVSYEDKFGSLGTIGVLLGAVRDRAARLEAWVLSCRAFSRYVEHASLRAVFEHLDVDELAFDFIATDKNKPLQDFLRAFVEQVDEPDVLTRSAFTEKCPLLHHRTVVEADAANASTHGVVKRST